MFVRCKETESWWCGVIHHVTVVGILALGLLGLTEAGEPCTEATNIGNEKRSTAYVLQDNDNPLCDSHTIITGDWYRFIQYNGQKMPETCPKEFACGTHVNIWMGGTHPTDDKIKNVTAYLHDGTNCKLTGYPIRVKRCQEQQVYYVYQLQAPAFCDAAYCAGDSIWCGFDKKWDDDKKHCVDRDVTETPHDVTEKTPSGGVSSTAVTWLVGAILLMALLV